MRIRPAVAVATSVGLVLAGGCGRKDNTAAKAKEKLRHIVVIMQENRSFDSYFGTYPGADGLPRRNGRFTVCVPDPKTRVCVRPYHDARNRNSGGPHEHLDAVRDIDGGRMDGFIREARRGLVAG